MGRPNLLPNSINVFFLKFYSLLSKVFFFSPPRIFWSLPFRLESFSKHLEILCFRSFIFLLKNAYSCFNIYLAASGLPELGIRVFHHGAWAFTAAQSCRAHGSGAAAHRLSRPMTCGLLVPDQGLNPRPQHQKGDSSPLDHQGSPCLLIFQGDILRR